MVRYQNIPSRTHSLAARRNVFESTPPPVAFVILSIIQVVMFFIYYSNYENKDKPIKFVLGPVPTDSMLIYDPNNSHQLWRYCTSIFVHLSLAQLFSCVGCQVVFGIFLEINYGWWRPLVIYFSGVFATLLFLMLVDPNLYISGGSGGVFALIFADFTSLMINWDDFQSTRTKENNAEESSFILICFLLDVFLLFACSDERTYEDQNMLTSAAGELTKYGPLLAGGLVGTLLTPILLRGQKVEHWGRVLWTIKVVPIYFGMMIFFFCMGVIGVMVDMERNQVQYDANYYYYRPYPAYRPYSRYNQYNSYRTYNTYRPTYSKPASTPAADPYGYKRSNNPYGFNRDSNPYGIK